MKLMIVDDSQVMQMTIERYLERLNLELIGKASNGREALEIFHEKKPDIVTMDITMPELDGLSCLEEIMKEVPETKVLVISALSDRATGLMALKRGAAGFLPKPFTEKDLIEEISILSGGSYARV